MSNVDFSATPEAVTHANTLLSELDACLVTGFARLGEAHRKSLSSLSRVFDGTPFETPVADAVTVLSKSRATEAHLVTFACAREALQAACFDALRAQALACLGMSVVSGDTASTVPALPVEAVTYMSSARQWLTEVALAGVGQLDTQAVVPFAVTLEAMQAIPSLFGLSALLTGFLDELMDHVPTASMTELPARRWADLWSRAMVSAWKPRPKPSCTPVSGAFQVLGADVRHHDHMISLVAYGALDAKEATSVQIVRTTISAWTVDAVTGDEIWTAFSGLESGRELLTAIAERKALHIKNMPRYDTGDLAWTGSASVMGKPYDPVARAVEVLGEGTDLMLPTSFALERHPVQLAVPVALTQVKCASTGKRETIEIAGARIPIAWERVSPRAEFGIKALSKCKRAFGLLRYDGGEWRFQPLAGKPDKGFMGPGASIARGLKIKKKSGTLGILQERASKLLRT